MDPKALVNQLLSQNPNMKQNANAMAMANAILNNDEKAGIELATNILNMHGLSREEGIEFAKRKFNIR